MSPDAGHQYQRPPTSLSTSSSSNLTSARPSTGPPQRSNNNNNIGQYSNQRSPSRPYNSKNQNYASRQQPQPLYRQNNAYNPQFQRYQNQSYSNPNQGYPNYQNYQGYQNFQPRTQEQQQQLPVPPQQRQITAGPILQPSGSGSTQYGNNLPPYRNGFTRQSQPQKAYHATVAEDEENDGTMQDQDGYQGDEYVDNDQQNDEARHDDVDVNFVTAPSEVRHKCKRCNNAIMSRNALFLHLRNECWKKQDDTSAVEQSIPGCIESAESAENIVVHAPSSATPRIVESIASPVQSHPVGYLFRSSEYTTANVMLYPNGPKLNVCFDFGCPITLGDREFLQQHIPDFSSRVKCMSSHIPVRGFGNKVSTASEFLSLDVFMEGIDELGPATAKITMEVHIVDHLKANVLVGTGVLNAHGISLDLGTQEAVIAKCNRIRIPICCVAKPHSQSRRVIKAHHAVTIAPNSIMDIPVVYHGNIPEDRDFLFEPQSCHKLGHDGGVYAHVVDSGMSYVKVKNSTPRPVKLPKHARLGTIVEYNGHGCYMVSPEAESLATCGWRISGQSHSEMPKNPARTDPSKEHQLSNGVTVYGDGNAAEALAKRVSSFEDVFTDAGRTVDIPESQWMPIKLKDGAQPKASKVYPLGQKDRQVVDETFDKLHAQEKLRFTDQPTPFSWPCFVVWRDTPQGRKGRVVIDIRGLNAITEDDSYPLPLQSDMVSLIAGYKFISTVDAVGYFHQFRVD
jgi:hypothetical protein